MDADAFFIAAEKSRLNAADMLRVDYDSRGKDEISFGPAAGNEGFGIGHAG